MWDYDTYDCDFNTHKSDSYTQSVIFTRMSVILTLTSVITTRTSVITTRTSVTLTWTNENYVRLLREIRDYVVFTSRTAGSCVWLCHPGCDFGILLVILTIMRVIWILMILTRYVLNYFTTI
jgi:hypothetical protein